MAQRKKITPTKQFRKRTVFTIISISMIILYTAVALILVWLDKQIPSELTVSWFSAWTVELGLLFGIKIHDKEN